MDKSADLPTGTDLPSPAKRGRRRLVQSTLFPHRPQDNAAIEADDCDGGEDEDEEYVGSQTKKRKQRKTKAATKSRASKKVAVNGKENPGNGVDGGESPIKPGFFAKVSGRRKQKVQQKEEFCVVSSQEDEVFCSPPDLEAAKGTKSPKQRKRRANTTPEKRRTSTTPKKKVMKNGLNEASSEQISGMQSEHPSQLIPDLRLEAKMTAEENSRIFGGRQIHPFFSSWKVGKKNPETVDEGSNWSTLVKKDKSIAFSPIHVFEKVQDDDFCLDWGKWTFTQRTCDNTSCGLGNECSSPVKSLQFDNFLHISPSTRTPSCQNDGTSDRCPIQVEANYEVTKTDSFLVHSGCGQDSDVEFRDIFLEERMMSSGNSCEKQPENSLWTNKYQPEKAIEVCGNGECVTFLNEWLRQWQEKGVRTSKTPNIEKDGYSNCFTNESDSEDIDEASQLKNVLLVTGPVGSGKSAAIYACAKEQGFQVIEINASDWRNGALVKQRFGEAVESHWRQCSMETPETSDINNFFKSSTALCNATAAQGSENDVIELVPLSDDEYTPNAQMTPWKSFCKENRTASDQSGFQTLILFEDVDATLCEDRGFLATIHQLAVTAKRPMILTSNRNDPVLPNNLDRLELCFTMPTVKEVLPLVNMVCAAEKTNIQPCLVERFIGVCNGDIRKTILLLQFWCQGQRYRKDRVQSAYGSLVFDPDAGHRILPKIICCAFPSQLSEIVEKEIAKSLQDVDGTPNLRDLLEEEGLDDTDLITNKIELDSIEAKKEAMLSRLCSDQDANELASQFDATCKFSNSSGSPVAFSRRSVRRRTDTVLSSESEEECFSDRFPVIPSQLPKDMDDKMNLEVVHKSSSQCLASEMSLDQLPEQLLDSQKSSRENYYHCAVTADYSNLNGMCRSFDISCVPESTYVPETQLFSEARSCGDVGNTADTAFTKNDSPVNEIDLNLSPSGLYEIPVLLRNSCVIKSSQEEEDVADCHYNSAEIANRTKHLSNGGINLNISPYGLQEIPILVRNTCDMESVQEKDEVADCPNNRVKNAFTENDICFSGIDLNISPSTLHEIPVLLAKSGDVCTESVQEEEEVADSHVDYIGAPREYQGIDECSRMKFSRRSKLKKKPKSSVASNSVQEAWSKLRNSDMDLQQYVVFEQKDASRVLKLVHGMSNLISEADMLLGDCRLHICDYLEPSMVPCENSHSFSWCDDQVKMASTLSEHGMCLFAKDIAAVNSSMDTTSVVDLAWEMVASSTSTVALGKLVNQDNRRSHSLEIEPLKSCISSQSESTSSLRSIVQSIVPSRSYLSSTKGEAFHEYLSSLSQISRSEASRLSQNLDKPKRKRVRVARNYLDSGAISLTPADITLLGQYNCYHKVSIQPEYPVDEN